MSHPAEEVRRYFALNNIKHQDVADKLGINKCTLSNLLRGERTFSKKISEGLQREFGFDFVYLNTGIGSLFPTGSSRAIAGGVENSTITQGDNSPIHISTANAALEAENARLRQEVEWLRSMLEKTQK